MSISRRRFNQSLLALAGILTMPLANAQSNAQSMLREGIDWRMVNPPVPRTDADKIEVLEFFSYGCPFCGELDPIIKPWAASLAEDVSFRQVPISFGRMAWANLARLYFVLEVMEETQRLSPLVFAALNQQGRRLFTERAITNWVELHDIDPEVFRRHFNSESVEQKLNASDALASAYGINAVPMIAVNGRFVVVGQEARSFNDLLSIATGLIEKARS